MTSYHIQPPSHFPFQIILLNSVRVERLHDKANTNHPYRCSLRVRVVPQVFVDNFPHRFLQGCGENIGGACASPKPPLPDVISILRDKKGKLAKSEQDQCKTSTHCDADKRNNCPSFANRDGFESGTKLNNITHFATATNSLGKNSLSIDAGWGKLNCASVFKQKCHVAGP